MSARIHSFPPIEDRSSQILILGSMPGAESLKKNQYYGHPRNQFWPIMFRLLGCEETDDYTSKVEMLKKNRIALWDVFSSCRRSGSLDSAIADAKLNDFSRFFFEHRHINGIFFNGQKAYSSFKKTYSDLSKFPPSIILPSTSPAYTVSIETKYREWSRIAQYLQ